MFKALLNLQSEKVCKGEMDNVKTRADQNLKSCTTSTGRVRLCYSDG
jgi:hypothetical protein